MLSSNSKLKSDILKVTGGYNEETVDFNETTSPSFLHEVTLDPVSSSNDGSTGPTMKDYEAQLNHFKKENFNLKLRIYFLEERLGPYRGGSEKEDPFKKNIELKVETETLRKELSDNQQLLRDAARAMDQLENQHSEALQKLMNEQKSEKSQLQLEVEKMKKEYQALLEQPNYENSAAMYAFAFGMPELCKSNNVQDKEAEEKLQQKIKELDALVEELQFQLNQEKIDNKQLELELVNTKTEKEELDQDVERYGSQMDEMKEKLTERDQELEDARKQVFNLEEALMTKEPEIRIKVQELAERDKMIDEANSKLEAKEKVLVEIQITLDEKQKQIEALRTSLASKDEAITGLRAKLANSESAQREFQEKMKKQWMDGMSLTPKQLLQFEKNIIKRRPNTYRNHRSITEMSNGDGSHPTKRPGTAPLPGKGSDLDDDTVVKLREEVEKWRKKAEEGQKEAQIKDELVKSKSPDEEKMKISLHAIVARSREFEKEVEKSKKELQRKDKKIRDLLCELTVAHDQVNKAKWEGANGVVAGRQHGMNLGFPSGLDEVKDMADEENERLWAELDDKKQQIKQLTDEKNTMTAELNGKIQLLMSDLKKKEEGLAVFEEKNNSLMLQLADKNERVKTLEAQTLSMESLANVCQRRPNRVSSISEWVSQQKIVHSSTVREMFSVRLSSASEEHSFLHSHIQKLQRNLRNTPEREGGPRGPMEEVEEARHESEEVCALLGGHLWELAVFLEGLLEETSLSLSESHKTSLRRALEWSRELSLSVLSTTGLADQSERDCTRTSLAVLRDFPSFCACIEMSESSDPSKKCKESVHIEEIDDSPNQEVAATKQDAGSLCAQDANVSMESLHSSVEALHCRVRELEKEVGGKIVDLREGSSEVGRGCNSGESVKTVRDARPSTLSFSQTVGNVSVPGSKQDACADGGLVNCVIASPSESEGWSEPDRTVSLARMGLEEMARSTASATVASAAQQSTAESGGSLVETRTPSKRSHGEVRRLQNRLRGLEQVIEALRAELRVYHSVASVTPMPVVDGLQETPRQSNVALELGQGDHEGPCTRDAEVNTTMGVQSEPVDTGGLGHLLEEVRCQRDKLEYSLKQNELIGQQLETVLSGLKCHQKEDGMTNLCQKLKEATDHLEEEQARCRDLQGQLVVARSSLLSLEAKLQESKDVELNLRVMLKDKEAQLQTIMDVEKIQEISKLESARVLSSELKEEVTPRNKDDKMFILEEQSGCKTQANISATKRDYDQDLNLNSFDTWLNNSSRKSSKLSEISIFENQKWQFKHHGPNRGNSFVEGQTPNVLEETETHNQSAAVNETPEVLCRYSDASNHTTKLLANPNLTPGSILKVESEVSQLRQTLKEAQERACIEEMRANKAEEDAHHWREIAKEQERLAKLPAAVVHVTEDPSEGSSSSALSGILTDLARHHSEMSDYVSDQTGGEDSEPSLPLSPNQKRSSCGRPGIIPLEMSSAGPYLSPPADISPTSRHDVFSSPDLGIESDPGRFSSLENPPKTPEEVGHSLKFTDIHSSGKTVPYGGPLIGNTKLGGTQLSSRRGRSADDLLSASCVNDLRLENEHLRQCLAETRKNLDQTMSKLEAANRRKLNVEKAICNQLQKTHHILRKARVNLGAEIRE